MDKINKCQLCGHETEVLFSERIIYIYCTNILCGHHNEVEET